MVDAAVKPALPPLRPKDVKEDDPRERARLRAAQIRQHRGPISDNFDPLHIDPEKIPDGWDYNWWTETVMGKDIHDIVSSRRKDIAEGGWTPVPRERHPEMMPPGSTHACITQSGQMLYERPMESTIEARQRELANARRQVRAEEARLGDTPPGTMERDADPRIRPRVSKHYEPVAIPADE